MEHGVWKKYEQTKMNFQTRQSYDELHDDLKDSGKPWSLLDYNQCMEHLCGDFTGEGYEAGDVYVYYKNDNGNLIPEFFIYISGRTISLKGQKEKNYILFNDCSLGYDGIDNKYLPELIAKLREIDEEKNASYIKELELRYERYQKLLNIIEKGSYSEEDLLFIYNMAYVENDKVAISELNIRSVKNDFDSMSDENKVSFYLSVMASDDVAQLTIDSKEVLMGLARNKHLKQLNNATDDIINDRQYMIELLETFFNAAKNMHSFEFARYLPAIYQTDIDILELAFANWSLVPLQLSEWATKNPTFKEKMHEPEFAYRIVDAYLRAYISAGSSYTASGSALFLLPEELLENVENHVLVSPESTDDGERLRIKSIAALTEEKEKVLSYKRKAE